MRIGHLVKRLWRALTRRRTVTWVGILGVTAVAFIALTRELSPNAVVKPALSWLIALIAWALAVLFWDLAIVWIEYVSQRRHLEYLKEVWGVAGPPEPPADAAKAEPERLWWTH
jgi:4-amino-4-deoxy-L-arabinose transferase-like glycosyltransferase